MFGGLNPEDLFRALFQQHGQQCNCKDCRVERGELHLTDLRELEPNEIESWSVLRARSNELKKLLQKADNLKNEVEALRTLFWNKLEDRLGDYGRDLHIDTDRMVLQEYNERK